MTGVGLSAQQLLRSLPVPAWHFSVDDVFDPVWEVAHGTVEPWKHPFFQFLRELHDHFGVHVALYLFQRQHRAHTWRDLSQMPLPSRAIFADVPWLSWGPHALDYETPPYAQTVEQQREFCETIYSVIDRMAGVERRSPWVRLHYFSEAYELAPYWKANGVEALLTTDKPAISYRLPPCEREHLCRSGRVEFGGIQFIRSHVRIEQLVERGVDHRCLTEELQRHCPPHQTAVVFTHEYELVRPEVREMTWRVMSCMKDLRGDMWGSAGAGGSCGSLFHGAREL